MFLFIQKKTDTWDTSQIILENLALIPPEQINPAT